VHPQQRFVGAVCFIASSAATSAASSQLRRSRPADATNEERIASDQDIPDASSERSARSDSSSSRTDIAWVTVAAYRVG